MTLPVPEVESDHVGDNHTFHALGKEHPLFVDPSKELSRFDRILLSNYSGSFDLPWVTNGSADLQESDARRASVVSVPVIRTIRCSTSSEEPVSDAHSTSSIESEADDSDDVQAEQEEDLNDDHTFMRLLSSSSEYENECSLSARAWSSLSTIPEAPTPGTDHESRTPSVVSPTDDHYDPESNHVDQLLENESPKADVAEIDDITDNFESSENGRGASDSPSSKYNTVTLGRNKLSKQTTLGAPSTTARSTPNGDAAGGTRSGQTATVTGASSLAQAVGASKKNGRAPLFRRHSAFQPKPEPECDMDTLLLECAREEALQVAFGRGKAWSRYSQIVISFYSRRLLLETEHAQKLQKLTEQTRNALVTDLKNDDSLPLFSVFNDILNTTEEFGNQAESTAKGLHERVVKSLQQRHDDHDAARRAMKADYAKREKALATCYADLRRATKNMEASQSNHFKARDVSSRSQQAVQAAGVLGPDHHRKMKEIEKKKRNEEEALQKRNDAEGQVRQLTMKRDLMQRKLGELKAQNISQLCESIIACDRTTQVGTSRFLEAYTNLWSSYPNKFNDLANEARQYRPGSEFMSFLQNLPGRSVSTNSLAAHQPAGPSEDEHGGGASTSTGGRSSTTSSLNVRPRRNALNEAEHYDLIVETQQHRKPKRSMGRLFDPLSAPVEYTEPTKSHKLVRTRQVIKCMQCDRVSLLSETVKCTVCGISWHKKCLVNNTVICGPNAKPFAESARRVSIFGVALKNHLELQKRQVPHILERCIDDIQKRGMRSRGLYRTCGVKSRVEQICQAFEQSDSAAEIKLEEDVHPMNIASVVKLYLRKLPEPLLSYELYSEFLEFDTGVDASVAVARLQDLIATKLPSQNYETLKFLLLHLKRVTWFRGSNMMTSSNLAAVITPSLLWAPITSTPLASTPASLSSANTGSFVSDAHHQTKVVDLLIKHVYEIFDVDGKADYKAFFERYSGVPEPVGSDSSPATDPGPDDLPLGDDDDDIEDDFDDDCEPTACSSSNVSQQPPTPDLLRNTNNNSKTLDLPGGGRPSFFIDNSTDRDDDARECVGGFEALQRKYAPATRTVSASMATELGTRTNAPQTPSPVGEETFTKQRSFTTSILVSPQNNRKLFLPQQHSMDSRTAELVKQQVGVATTCRRPVESFEDRAQTLRSGEVTIDKKQDQFFLPSPSTTTATGTTSTTTSVPTASAMGTGASPKRVMSAVDRPPAGPVRTPTSPDQREQCLNGLGLIFSTGSDVSYV